ncbi:efflux RND transporter periplasmic adaptor subunit [Planctomycetota bacterium]
MDGEQSVWLRLLTMRGLLTSVIIVGAAAGGFFYLKPTVFAPSAIPVRVAHVERGRVELTVTNSRAGTVRARRRAQLSPETGGRVAAIACREGASVDTGSVLLRLDQTSQKARLLLVQRTLGAAEAQRGEAQVRVQRAARELTRHRQLAQRGITSTDRLDELESAHEATVAAVATAAARVEQARAEVALVDTELLKTVLRAPFAGVLAELSVEVGEWITPAPPLTPVPSVMDLIDTSSIYVSAPMDETDSALFLTGQRVRVTLDPFPDRAFSGHIVRVACYVLDVETQNRTVEIEVELEDDEFAAGLLPGTSADVEVIISVCESALRIPTSALMEGERVLVLTDDVLAERKIGTGLKNWDYIEVKNGLREGERVVTTLGKAEIKAGVRVVIEGTDAAR